MNIDYKELEKFLYNANLVFEQNFIGGIIVGRNNDR